MNVKGGSRSSSNERSEHKGNYIDEKGNVRERKHITNSPQAKSANINECKSNS